MPMTEPLLRVDRTLWARDDGNTYRLHIRSLTKTDAGSLLPMTVYMPATAMVTYLRELASEATSIADQIERGQS